jgi:O-antigen/teichoic acid export membrane protein
VFRTIHGTTGCVLTSIGRQHYRTFTQLTAVALNFGLNLWLIPAHGWHGAAWASLVTDGSLALLNWCGLRWLTRALPVASSETSAAEDAALTTHSSSQPLVSVIVR